MTSDGDALAMWDPPGGTVETPPCARLPSGALHDWMSTTLRCTQRSPPSRTGIWACWHRTLGVGARGSPDSLPGRARRSGCRRCRRCSKRPTPTTAMRTVGLADHHRAGRHRRGHSFGTTDHSHPAGRTPLPGGSVDLGMGTVRSWIAPLLLSDVESPEGSSTGRVRLATSTTGRILVTSNTPVRSWGRRQLSHRSASPRHGVDHRLDRNLRPSPPTSSI